MHAVCPPSGCCVPGGHHVQLGLPIASVARDPTGHKVQPPVDALEWPPGSHAMQRSLDGDASVPSSQRAHAELPRSATHPAGHAVQPLVDPLE